MKAIQFYNRNLSIWVVLFAIVAFFFPNPFLLVKSSINIFFAITMFGIGLVITETDYRNIIKNPKIVLFGNLCQFTIMPILALITSTIFNLPREVTVGLILTGSAPGAMTSNVISYLSEGDVAFSVSMTALATLICPVLTPLLTLLLAGKMVPVPFWQMFFTILYTVVVPLLAGFLVRRTFPKLIVKIGDIPPAISVTAIIIICAYVVAANNEDIGKATALVLLAVIAHNLMGMLLGFLAGGIAKFTFRRKKTLSIEIGMQNAGLGVILALQHFSKEVAIPAALFTIWCIISASLLVGFWKFLERKAPENTDQ